MNTMGEDDIEMLHTTPTQPLKNRRWDGNLQSVMLSTRIGLRAVQKALQWKSVLTLNKVPLSRVPIAAAKDVWVKGVEKEGLGIFDAILIGAAIEEKRYNSVEELVENTVDELAQFLRKAKAFVDWNSELVPVGGDGQIMGGITVKRALEIAGGIENYTENAAVIQLVISAVKRAQGGSGSGYKAPERINLGESEEEQLKRKQEVQVDQDRALKDLILGLGEQMKQNTLAVQASTLEQQKTNQELKQVSGRVGQIEVQFKTLETEVGEIKDSVEILKDSTVEMAVQNSQLARDGKCLLLSGKGAAELFEEEGEGGVKALLLEWEKAYSDRFGGISIVQYIENAWIRLAPFDFRDKRVLIQVWDKPVRDELVKRCKLSPARDRDGLYVAACLTQHQRLMRGKLKDKLDNIGGMKMSLASDVAEIWKDGRAGAYRIDLDLPWVKIEGLLEHALAKLAERPEREITRQVGKQRGEMLCAVSWNMGGFADFKILISGTQIQRGWKGQDIIALQETHCSIKGQFGGFQDIEQVREIGRGGGIYMGIKEGWIIEERVIQDEYIIARINRGVFRVIVINVYIPPINSRYKRDFTLILAEITEHVQRLMASGGQSQQLVMLGDFNAHTAGLQGDGIRGISESLQGHEGGLLRKRFCKDRAVDRRGKQLMATCRDNQWMVLNGRTRSDPAGEFTYMARGAASTVDYVIVKKGEQGDMGIMKDLMVVSDGHGLIWTTLDLIRASDPGVVARQWAQGIRMAAENNPGEQELLQHKGYILTAEGVEELRKHPVELPGLVAFMDREEQMQGSTEEHSEDTGDEHQIKGQQRVDQIMSLFESELALHIDQYLVRKEGRKGKGKRMNPTQFNRKQKMWFDRECKAALQRVYWARRNDRGQVKGWIREYKRVVKRKRRQFGNQLEQYRISNPREFWEMLKDERVACSVPLDELVEHYQKLLGNEQHRVREEGEYNRGGALIEEFQQQEVEAVIAKLGNNKSSGGSWIKAEVLKGYCHPGMITIITRMFNVFRFQGLPSAWNELQLVQVHKKGPTDNPNNFRGIALMPVLAKVYAQVILKRIEVLVDSQGLRAKGQAGFRKGFRVEDNAMVLKSMVEVMQSRGQGMWVCFVDLEKAYDKISRSVLWEVMEGELGIPIEVMVQLRRMYKDVRARVVGNEERADGTIPVTEGVKQGCPASPILFSLLMDRVEKFIETDMEREGDLARRKQRASMIRVGAVQIMMLLFADDLVLCARTREGLQRMMIALERFVDQNRLKVNVGKTKVMRMGKQAEGGIIEFKGEQVEEVEKFVYLGLVFDKQGKDDTMMERILSKSKAAWTALHGKITSNGWQQTATRVLLLDTLVRSHLIYGAPVWAAKGLRRVGVGRVGMLGKLCKLYRSAQRILLGLQRRVPNDILAAVSVRPPLELFLAKQVMRYYQALGESDLPGGRLAREVLEAVTGVEGESRGVEIFTAGCGHQLAEETSTIPELYASYRRQATERLRADTQGLRPELVEVWDQIIQLGMLEKRKPLYLDILWTQFRSAFPLCKALVQTTDRSTQEKLRLWAWPQWLLGGIQGVQGVVDFLYYETGWFREGLFDQLKDRAVHNGDEGQLMLCDLVQKNGLAVAMWVAGGYIREMVLNADDNV